VLHTGQHYDRLLSAAFLEQLDFPAVRLELGVGSGTHAEQTAAVMVGVERVLKKETGLGTPPVRWTGVDWVDQTVLGRCCCSGRAVCNPNGYAQRLRFSAGGREAGRTSPAA